VGTPRLLDFADNDDLTVLLLAAHTPASPAREWDLAAWLEVAGDLAALHSIPLPEDPPWVHVPWVQQVLDRPPAHVALDYWSGTRAGTGVASMLKTAVALVATLDEAPRCFNHGDCHAANLLRDGSRFLWSDWEVAGIGTPAIDLAFLWLRANSDDADVPYDAMLQEYARLTSIDPVLLRRSAIAAELGFTVYGFPDYAGHHSDRQRERVTSRLLELIAEWDTGP
jgi:aminoglycoside phosphotransferase (APT) family kinase protein